jgi:acyl-CoA synthetase (AMP-forming)/AMP-acid ligase II
VYPEEVEAVVKSLPSINDAVVLGAPDETYGERVVAIVAGAIDLDALQAHCRPHLAGYKLPRAVYLVDAIPRTPAGKVDYAWARDVVTRSRG